jgi:hypothetical protein
MAMNPANFEQFIQQARTRLTGVSDTGLKQELFDVLKEFFKDSNAWTEDIQFTPVSGTSAYRLAPLEDGQIIRLVGVFDDKGIPVPAFMPVFGTVQLTNIAQPASNTVQWTARVVKNVVLPTDRKDIPVCPDWVLSVYEDTILDGICGRLMGQMGKSYTNPQMSKYHLQRFRTGITNARTAAIRQNVVGGQEWAYPRGWGSSSQRGGVSTAWPTRAF